MLLQHDIDKQKDLKHLENELHGLMGGGYTGNQVTRLSPPLGASIIAREVGEFLLFVNIVLPIFPLLAAVCLNFTNTFCC